MQSCIDGHQSQCSRIKIEGQNEILTVLRIDLIAECVRFKCNMGYFAIPRLKWRHIHPLEQNFACFCKNLFYSRKKRKINANEV